MTALALALLAIGILGGAVVAVLLARTALYRPPIPREIPQEERNFFRAVFVAARREFLFAAWGQFPPGLQRFDARVYAAGGFVLIRDCYLSDTAGISRVERELVATTVSVSNTCYYCTHNHSALLQASPISGIEKLVMEREVDQIEDPRHRQLARFALMAKQPANLPELASAFTAVELSDIAMTLFGFNYVNRIVDVVGPTTGIQREAFAKPPPTALATILGLKRSYEPGAALDAIRPWSNQVRMASIDDDDDAIRRWTLDDPAKRDSVRYVWSMISAVAAELFDAEVLVAIRRHLRSWTGGEYPLTGHWHREHTKSLSTENNRRLGEFGILIARCAHRVDPDLVLQACDGSLRKRLVLVAYAACAAALRVNEWLPMNAARGAVSPDNTPTRPNAEPRTVFP
ncbi:MAG: hypothetical protein AAGA48_38110 [Myxococcota bacterium]